MLDLTGQRILITGGAGFVGRALSDHLRGFGCKNLFTPRSADADLRDRAQTAKLIQTWQPTVIIHLAAKVGGIGANRANPGTYFHDNMAMGLNLIDEARLYRESGGKLVKFVQLGTVCAYPKHAPVPFKEDDLWNGYPEGTNAPYGVAKKALLVMLQAYRAQYGFPGIYLLPVNLYGPQDNFDLASSHVIPAMIRKFDDAKRSGVKLVKLWGDGSPTREFLYVGDAARAISLATQGYESAEPVNLGSGEEIAMKDLAAMIARLTGYSGAIEWDSAMPNGQPRRKLDTSRAKAFGFASQVKLEDGLRLTTNWWQANRPR